MIALIKSSSEECGDRTASRSARTFPDNPNNEHRTLFSLTFQHDMCSKLVTQLFASHVNRWIGLGARMIRYVSPLFASITITTHFELHMAKSGQAAWNEVEKTGKSCTNSFPLPLNVRCQLQSPLRRSYNVSLLMFVRRQTSDARSLLNVFSSLLW